MEKYTIRLCNSFKLEKFNSIEIGFETNSLEYEDNQSSFHDIFLEFMNMYFEEWYEFSNIFPLKNELFRLKKDFCSFALKELMLDKWEYKDNYNKSEIWKNYNYLTNADIESLLNDESGFSLSSNDCSLLRKMFERFLNSGSWHIGFIINGKFIEKNNISSIDSSYIPAILFGNDNDESNEYFYLNSNNINENIWLKHYKDEFSFIEANEQKVFHEHLLMCEAEWGHCEPDVFEIFLKVKNKCPVDLNQTNEKIISDIYKICN